MTETTDQPGPTSSGGWLGKVVLFIAVVFAAGLLYFIFRDQLTLEYLAQREEALREFQQTQSGVTFALAFLIYVIVTGLSLPGAGFMTIVCGWLFGFWPALVLVSFASTTGATIAFLLSRYFFRETLECRFGHRLEKLDGALEREGPFYLFTLRLIPAVPFFVINAGMGLTKMRVWTFWWVSQLGMLAGTCVYVFAGSSVPKLSEFQGVGSLPWYFWAACVALGVFPIAAKKTIEWIRPSAARAAEKTQDDTTEPNQIQSEGNTDE